MLLFGLINFKLAVDFLGVEGFGLVNLYISIVLLFAAIFGFKVYEAGSYAINKAKQNSRNLRSVYMYFFKLELLIKLSLSIFFIFSVFVYNYFIENKYEIYFLAFLLFANTSMDLSKQVLVSLDNLKPYYYIRLVQPISMLIFLIVSTLYSIITVKIYLTFYMLSILLESVLSFLFVYSLSLKYYSTEVYKPDFNLMKFNRISYFSSTFKALWEKTDYLWVNFLSSHEMLGIYAIAKKITEYTSLIAFTYWNSLKPAYTKNFNSNIGLKIIKKYQKDIVMFFFVIIVVLILLIKPLTVFLQIVDIKEFMIIILCLLFANLMWSLIVMSRYVATLFNKLEYSLAINIQLALLLNIIVSMLYVISNYKNIYFIILAQAIIALYAYIFWKIRIDKIYDGLK